MQYHRNANTNINQRQRLHKSNDSSRKLAEQYAISHVTANKWKDREDPNDKSSRPHTIHYAIDRGLWTIVKAVRKKALLPLDDLFMTLKPYIEGLNRSNCYRILCHYHLNQLSTEEKRESKKFATYKPGYLHIDLFYLPKIDGKRYYCYLAIDRATRMVFLELYPRKRKEEAADFLVKCLNFFPYKVHHILTDNGTEFTMRGRTSFGGINENPTYFEIICEIAGIKHRKTKPRHPWTNGMAERMVRTVKEHTTHITRYSTTEEAVEDIKNFQDVHNFRRKLKVLQNQTPYEVTMKWFIKEPDLFINDPTELLTT